MKNSTIKLINKCKRWCMSKVYICICRNFHKNTGEYSLYNKNIYNFLPRNSLQFATFQDHTKCS